MGTNGIGTTRQIDQLGRVVVPAALRRMLGINVGDTLEFTARGEELVLRRVAPSCAICGSDAEDLVDMHDKHARKAEITMNGSPPAGETVLSFIALDESGARTGQGSNFALTDGKSDGVTALPGGRYMYWLNTLKHHGLICGIVNVPEAGDATVVKIDWHGNEIPRDRLGAGVELVSIDGFSCASLKPSERQIRWSGGWGASVTTLLVPDKCEYNVLK